ncbi:MAG: hypothetical protein ACM3NT_11435 [Methylocystaceae bacterium]
MNLDGKIEGQKPKKSVGTIILYTAVAVIALSGLAIIVSNVWMYISAVNQYVSQGYPRAEVVKQLLPSQLIPGILQPLALYEGIALLLFYSGKIYDKVAKCLVLLNPDEADTVVAESPFIDSPDGENLEISEPDEVAVRGQID